MSEPTPIRLPGSVPFPVTISSILCKEGDTIKKHTPLIKYKYWDYQDDPNSKEEEPPKIRVERIGSYESPIEGQVTSVLVGLNEEVPHSGVDVAFIAEPCNHAVQYGGLCALCGKALDDEKDYSGYNFEDRATILMSHDASGLKVSLDEAAKIEQSTTERLIEQKKLILVVDLDQTVIHATVDPTVGEWQLDPSNPNYPFVKEVQSFCLEEEIVPRPAWTGPKIQPSQCWYYVKLRPGLLQFLKNVSQLYELHIYTMATRNYALEIAKIIDPTGDYFGDRILSRDESGSLTHKNLKRLFPVDQSMVAIIDDRGDVWKWESNLIKVVPYDFFVGIGDINSSFLPKKNGELTGPTKKRKSIAKLEAMEAAEEAAKESEEDAPLIGNPDSKQEEEKVAPKVVEDVDMDEDPQNGIANPVDRILEMGGGEGNTELLLEQKITRNQSIEQQQHDRPLAKLQHDLDKLHSESGGEDEDEDDDDNLLYDDDNELYLLNKALERIHSVYYEELAKNNKPDLTQIIPALKSKALSDVVVLFSGFIPLNMSFESADIVVWCKQFGVTIVKEVTPDVTHVVCRQPINGSGLTAKVRMAKKMLPDAKIVNPDWLFSCLSTWEKVNEKDYLIYAENENDWDVNDSELDKYKAKLVRKEEQKQQSESVMIERERFDSVGSFDDYNLDAANQEVDDFLAGISDDEDEDEDEDQNFGSDGAQENAFSPNTGTAIDATSNNGRDGADEEDEEDEEEERESKTNGSGNSFIKGLYKESRKRKAAQIDSDEEEEYSKKKSATTDSNLDELEQELLNGFVNLEE